MYGIRTRKSIIATVTMMLAVGSAGGAWAQESLERTTDIFHEDAEESTTTVTTDERGEHTIEGRGQGQMGSGFTHDDVVDKFSDEGDFALQREE